MTDMMKLVLSIVCICICKVQADDILKPTVTVKINTAASEIHQGGAVELQCDVTGLNLPGLAGFIVEWRRPSNTLVWNGTSYDLRYNVISLPYDSKVGTLSQHMTFAQLVLSDTDVYACNLKVFKPAGFITLDSDNVTLSIPHFPEQSPTCTPYGPLVVALNQQIHLSCSSALGYPTVALSIMKQSTNVTGMFVALETDEFLSRETDITVTAEDDSASFECLITSPYYFPLIKRGCTIGPLVIYPGITTTQSTQPTISTNSNTTHSTPTSTHVSDQPSSTIESNFIMSNSQIALVAGLASSIVVLAFVLTVLCLLFAFRSVETHPHDVTKRPDEEDLTSRRSTPPFHILDFEIYNPRQWPRRSDDRNIFDIPEFYSDVPESSSENSDLDFPMYYNIPPDAQ